MSNISSIIISCLVLITSIAGWYVSHSYSAARDLKNKKKEIVTNYLINAFHLIVDASNGNNEKLVNFEKANANILLFGTPREISLATKFAKGLETNGKADNTELLEELRKNLRKELNLEEVTGNWCFVKVRYKNK